MTESVLAAVGAELKSRFPDLYLPFRRIWPRLRPHLGDESLASWAQGVLSLAAAFPDGVAPAFVQASAQAASLLAPEPFAQWQAVGLALAGPRPQEAADFFLASPQAMRWLVPEARGPFLALCLKTAEPNPTGFSSWFREAQAALAAIPPVGQRPLLRLAGVLDGGRGALSFFGEAMATLGQLLPEQKAAVLAWADNLARSSPEGALVFLKACPELLSTLRLDDLEKWWSEGERLLRHDQEAGLRFLTREAPESREFLDSLAPAVELRSVRDVLVLYNQALTGVNLQVLPVAELAKLGIGWSRVEAPTTEGTAIFCPERVGAFPSRAQNFEVYKVLVAHQAGHLERGSFGFDFQRASTQFADLRPLLAQIRPPRSAQSVPLARFFDLFSSRRLATDVFTTVEDARVDSQLTADYRGLRRAYGRVRTKALEGRPALEDFPLREACLEALLRFSAGGASRYRLPQLVAAAVMEAASYLRAAETRPATVEDAAEASLRLYALLCPIPNWLPWPEPVVEVDLSQASWPREEEDPESLVGRFLAVDREAPRSPVLPGPQPEEHPYRSLPTLDSRGTFKPELVQAVSLLRGEIADPNTQAQISTAELRDMLLHSVEVERPPSARGDAEAVASVIMSNLLRELGKGWDQGRPSRRIPRRRRVWRPEAEALLQSEAIPYTYDEWDFRRRAYRPDWCTLWERLMEEGSIDFYEDTLSHHKALLTEVRRQFELLKPSRRRRHKRLPDGEEFDLDAVVETMVERRAGQANSDKIYWRRDKSERDVSVVIVLDMSVSTMEAIEDPRGAPGGKVKRIIDLEKESLVLLTQALELVGDTYGIYGFSGLGRQNAQFFVIKDLKERFSERVKRRIDRMIPIQGTRMAPAIRHAIAKLEQFESKTRLLILISDGRPQDQDYGRDPADASVVRGGPGGWSVAANPVRDAVLLQEVLMLREKEYAVHDTRRALLEARQKNIVPFCISVDRRGHDYLRAMCGDMGYEVVGDISSLPQRLTALYRRLTT